MFMDFKPIPISALSKDSCSDTEKLVKITNNMTNDELQLLITITVMIADNPARREFALNWPGKMRDLPAALAAI